MSDPASERMDIVIVGHVDHGKSTVIGRLMADSGSLPDGKLEQVRAMCERNARPFEYAFLLDALKAEQAQGITIDTARCFFKTGRRHYVIHDAPGHVEFLKNMVTGATRAEAALLVIDAKEGLRENTMRHGYILSMLGIRQVAVLVNKMDLVDFDELVFDRISSEYGDFLGGIGVTAARFIPVSARDGDNIACASERMSWYSGPTVLEQADLFERAAGWDTKPFRMPVQDVYKFTARGDDRRIVAGTVESGVLRLGDEVVFLPSGKRSRVATFEVHGGVGQDRVLPDAAVGFTLETQVYVRPGELAVRADEPEPNVGRRFRAHVFWMGRAPMVPGSHYRLQLGSFRGLVELAQVCRVFDASDLGTIHDKQQLDRHDVAECILETRHPVAFDPSDVNERTARFVIIDDFDIAACGIVLARDVATDSLLAEKVKRREKMWVAGSVGESERVERYGHRGKSVLVIGSEEDGATDVARTLERELFDRGVHAYLLGLGEGFDALDPSEASDELERAEHLERLGDTARIITDAGLVFITVVNELDRFELDDLRLLNKPNELLAVAVGGAADASLSVDIRLKSLTDAHEAAARIAGQLAGEGVLPEYFI